MTQQRPPKIEEYLQNKDVQKRIRTRMQEARSEAAVTIGRVTKLFGFTENQLRDWEKKGRGWLNPQRPDRTEASENGKSGGHRHRQYSLGELDKLAILEELIKEGKYSLSDIPPNIDELWQKQAPVSEENQKTLPADIPIFINQRIERERNRLFFRFYASHVLRMCLMIISEDIPNTTAGLILPLHHTAKDGSCNLQELPDAGESLVGWLSKSGSSHTLLTDRPMFQYSSDYTILPLVPMQNEQYKEEPADATCIILERPDRRSKLLTLRPEAVNVMRRLLATLYEDVERVRDCFGMRMHDWMDASTDFKDKYPDKILDGFANMIVHLGGSLPHSLQPRWKFCCILSSANPELPVQMQSLVLRSKSDHAPENYRVGEIRLNPGVLADRGICLRSFMSADIIYRPFIPNGDDIIAHHEEEGFPCSAIAVPIGGEKGISLGVIYVASAEKAAFAEEDHRLLRIIARMLEEVLLTYQFRLLVTKNLTYLINKPDIIDSSFKEFHSENDFINEIEDLLTEIHEHGIPEELQDKEVSIISIDIDQHGRIARKYGNQAARNLVKEVGLRLLNQKSMSTELQIKPIVYHAYVDRFYLFLPGVSLKDTRKIARQLKKNLTGKYQVSTSYSSQERLSIVDEMIVIDKVTVHMGISSYKADKLKEVLGRYSDEVAVARTRSVIIEGIEAMESMGQQGDIIITWDSSIWWYRPLPPEEEIEK